MTLLKTMGTILISSTLSAVSKTLRYVTTKISLTLVQVYNIPINLHNLHKYYLILRSNRIKHIWVNETIKFF